MADTGKKDAEITKNIQEYKLYKQQADFVEAKQKYVSFVGGRGSGKSYAGCLKDVLYILEHPACEGMIAAPCYDDETEILTEKRGWKLFRDLLPEDKVATLKDGKYLEYQTPLEYYDFPYKGDMIYLKNQEIDLAVTPNHRCFIREQDKQVWKFKTAEDIYRSSHIYFNNGLYKENLIEVQEDDWNKKYYNKHIYCLHVPNEIVYVRRSSKPVWCLNSHPWLRDTTRKTFFDLFPKSEIKKYNMTNNILITKNDSVIYFRSLDNPDSIRGLNLAFGHIDEAAYVSSQAWKIFKATLRQEGYPLQGWITTTPRGRNWIYDEWEKDKTEHHLLIRARSDLNKHLPPDFVETLGYSGSFFNQEVLGQFESFEGLVYPDFDLSPQGHIQKVDWDGPRPLHVYCGVDWGWRDPAVLLVIADMGGYYHVIDEWYQPRQLVEDIAQQAYSFQEKYGVEAFYCDPSRPDSIAALRAHFSLPLVHEANNDIMVGVSAVTSAFSKKVGEHYGLLVDPRCQELIRELGVYQYPDEKNSEQAGVKKSTKNQGEKPVDANNHACLVGSTLIETDYGPIPLYLVTEGMKVLTRTGFHTVLEWSLTKRNASLWKLSLSTGKSLLGTGDHPVYVQGQGMTPLSSLKEGDTLYPEDVTVLSLEKIDQRENVYNISVSLAKEYYAEGILVSNCDALRYTMLAQDPALGKMGFVQYGLPGGWF